MKKYATPHNNMATTWGMDDQDVETPFSHSFLDLETFVEKKKVKVNATMTAFKSLFRSLFIYCIFCICLFEFRVRLFRVKDIY